MIDRYGWGVYSEKNGVPTIMWPDISDAHPELESFNGQFGTIQEARDALQEWGLLDQAREEHWFLIKISEAPVDIQSFAEAKRAWQLQHTLETIENDEQYFLEVVKSLVRMSDNNEVTWHYDPVAGHYSAVLGSYVITVCLKYSQDISAKEGSLYICSDNKSGDKEVLYQCSFHEYQPPYKALHRLWTSAQAVCNHHFLSCSALDSFMEHLKSRKEK